MLREGVQLRVSRSRQGLQVNYEPGRSNKPLHRLVGCKHSPYCTAIFESEHTVQKKGHWEPDRGQCAMDQLKRGRTTTGIAIQAWTSGQSPSPVLSQVFAPPPNQVSGPPPNQVLDPPPNQVLDTPPAFIPVPSPALGQVFAPVHRSGAIVPCT
jgi:hypothetical protein